MKGGRLRLKLRRDHQRVVPINRWISGALKCNTAAILLATSRDAQASAFYTTGYMTKAPHKPHQLNLIYAAAVEKYQQKTATPVGDTMAPTARMVLACINGLHSKIEFGGPMIALHCLQHPDHYKSHDSTAIMLTQFMHCEC